MFSHCTYVFNSSICFCTFHFATGQPHQLQNYITGSKRQIPVWPSPASACNIMVGSSFKHLLQQLIYFATSSRRNCERFEENWGRRSSHCVLAGVHNSSSTVFCFSFVYVSYEAECVEKFRMMSILEIRFENVILELTLREAWLI